MTRLMEDEDLDSNKATFDAKSVNFKELSRLTIEDVLQCIKDTSLLLCIDKCLNTAHGNKLFNGAKKQRKAGVGRD